MYWGTAEPHTESFIFLQYCTLRVCLHCDKKSTVRSLRAQVGWLGLIGCGAKNSSVAVQAWATSQALRPSPLTGSQSQCSRLNVDTAILQSQCPSQFPRASCSYARGLLLQHRYQKPSPWASVDQHSFLGVTRTTLMYGGSGPNPQFLTHHFVNHLENLWVRKAPRSAENIFSLCPSRNIHLRIPWNWTVFMFN